MLPIERPKYDFDAQPGTRIRNGQTIRAFSLKLSDLVRGVLEQGSFPLVIGGDCSLLLGNLYGLRHCGGRGLVHRELGQTLGLLRAGLSTRQLAVCGSLSGCLLLILFGFSPDSDVIAHVGGFLAGVL